MAIFLGFFSWSPKDASSSLKQTFKEGKPIMGNRTYIADRIIELERAIRSLNVIPCLVAAQLTGLVFRLLGIINFGSKAIS